MWGTVARRFSAVAAAIGVPLLVLAHAEQETPLDVTRNFYGVVSVWDVKRDDPAAHYFAMQVDGVSHGRQFAEPSKRSLPVSYYSTDAAVGRVLTDLHERGSGLRVGVVGLGVGTLAAYAQPGDTFRFYEINPAVRGMAETHFTYLKDCHAPVEIVMGDARISLEREAPQGYDVLVLDAFSGHAIPAHLLTREAMAIYLRHLKPDGALLFHVTNEFLDLQAVVQKLGEEFGLESLLAQNTGDSERLTMGSRWMVLSRDTRVFSSIPAAQVLPNLAARSDIPLWTDSFNDLFRIIKK
jgi:hypothetical protein